MKGNDITGNRFGRLVVLGRVLINNRTRWACLCDCGTVSNISKGNLEHSNTKSCGCLINEKKTTPARFFNGMVDKQENGCWVYKGFKLRGYGQLKVTGLIHGKSTWRAHRLAWFFQYGYDAGDLLVCHKCDNPSCVNPDHLFLGTSKDNTQDMMRKGRARMHTTPRKTVCPNGHAFDPDNYYLNPGGHKSCRICAKERSRIAWLVNKHKKNKTVGLAKNTINGIASGCGLT